MATKKNPPKKTPKPDDTDETREESEGTEGSEDEDGDDSEAENRRINAIVTSRVKREMKPLLAAMQSLQESVTKLSTPKKPDDEESDGDSEEEPDAKTKKPRDLDPKVERKLTKLEKELADERAARKQAEQDRTAELERGKKSE